MHTRSTRPRPRGPARAAAALLLAACVDGAPPLPSASAAGPAYGSGSSASFVDVTATHVPPTPGSSMDAQSFDADGDGDLDLLIAKEFAQNVLLLNDGTGRMTVAPPGTLPAAMHDSEDVAVADYDRDGDLDAVVAAEDDRASEFYDNAGAGVFTDAGSLLPARGISNSVIAADVDGDGDADLVFGNDGQDFLFINTGGRFSDQTRRRLPADDTRTQDMEAGDVDGDGDLDLVVGNAEGGNRLLLNDGRGFFSAAAAGRLPLHAAAEETREADLADVDGDGDLDLYFANVAFVPGADPQDRLLINDGRGYFADQTAARLQSEKSLTVDAEFMDVDHDGDLDLVTTQFLDAKPYRAALNDGAGVFTEATGSVLPSGLKGEGIDAEVADFDGDGRLDIYFCSYRGSDSMILGR
jgi:hypothetical protein